MSHPPVRRAGHVRRAPAETFTLFTAHLASWWPLLDHSLFGDESAGVDLIDGRVVERAVDGRTAVWAEIVMWDPPNAFALAWHPGQPADLATSVHIRFSADGDGTRIDIEHSGWERFGTDADAVRRMYSGPNAWGAMIDLFASLTELDPATAPTIDLRGAYDAFFAAALAGGFGPAPAGEWSAEQVVAHIAVNDDLLAVVLRQVLADRAATFDNARSNDVQRLDTWIAGRDLPTLVAEARTHAAQVCDLLDRTNEDQRATLVHCRLVDGGQVALDEPRPIGALLLMVQPQMHLPGHVAQLEALRT
jgi:hypothetical protein